MNYPCREIDELNISTRKNPALPTHTYGYRRLHGFARCQEGQGEDKSDSKL